tara:strand:- start:1513 stop:1698 length:186 start_codon:yes stop_codon:yes gene_type:complete
MAPERYVPTPEDIIRVCAEIREGWSKERWERQRVNAERGWMPPLIGTRELTGMGESRAGND